MSQLSQTDNAAKAEAEAIAEWCGYEATKAAVGWTVIKEADRRHRRRRQWTRWLAWAAIGFFSLALGVPFLRMMT